MEPEKKSNGAFIGLAIIVIILIIGGIYAWQSKVNLEKQNETLSVEDENTVETLDQDLNTLETDLGVDVNAIE
jgi:uncharacterized protein HemX